MAYELIRDGADVRLVLQGSLTSSDHHWFRTALDAALEGQPATLIIDLAGIGRVDSSGLRMLVILRDQATRQHVSVVLTNLSAAVKRLMEMVDFPSLFEIRGES